MSQYYADKKLLSRDSAYTVSPDALCLFFCTPSGFPKENVISILEPEEGSVFSKCQKSVTAILPYKTQVFLCNALKDRDTHFVLLLSNDRTPILVATGISEYGGLCLALALPEDVDTVLSYLRSIPRISVQIDPALSDVTKVAAFDPTIFERLRQIFSRVFTFFEATYSAPMRCVDPIALFRLMKQKAESLASLFGLEAQFLIPYTFEEPIRADVEVNMSLFSATVLLLFSAIKQHSAEETIRIVFLSLNGCPAACIHFRAFAEVDITSFPYYLFPKLCARFGGYFKLSHGEGARKEAEKIPGVGFMVRNERYSTLGEHVLCAFSPVSHDFAEYISRSPIFHLPDTFYEGF